MNTSRRSSTETHGLPVCIAACHLDGLVLALTPNSHGYNYRSAVLFGHASVVEDEKHDKENGEVVGRVWTGVAPVYQMLGLPVPGPYKQLEGVSGYLKGFVEDSNGGGAREAAVAAATKLPTKSDHDE
ncbi:hypothetical protein LZ30DRAFT_785900 [Colletotrichum cereale]|nr:hypothetical protein LZ30DRAFT_785900 [Colletotrichum cereale]